MMEKTKTIRNPFPWIGKVFKYEMKHLVRILLPVNIAIIAIAFISGLMVPVSTDGDLNFHFTYRIGESENVMNGLSGFFFSIFCVLVIVSAVVTVSIISKRFKNGLLGDEAYLNLSLPVTIGEHLWGRILTIIVWDVIYTVVMLISLLLLFIKNLSLLNLSGDFLLWFWAIFALDLASALCLILFIYMINSIGHLSKKNRSIVKLVAVIIIISITSKITGAITYNIMDIEAINFFYIYSLIAFALSIIYGCVTYFILKLKLNLE